MSATSQTLSDPELLRSLWIRFGLFIRKLGISGIYDDSDTDSDVNDDPNVNGFELLQFIGDGIVVLEVIVVLLKGLVEVVDVVLKGLVEVVDVLKGMVVEVVDELTNPQLVDTIVDVAGDDTEVVNTLLAND